MRVMLSRQNCPIDHLVTPGRSPAAHVHSVLTQGTSLLLQHHCSHTKAPHARCDAPDMYRQASAAVNTACSRAALATSLLLYILREACSCSPQARCLLLTTRKCARALARALAEMQVPLRQVHKVPCCMHSHSPHTPSMLHPSGPQHVHARNLCRHVTALLKASRQLGLPVMCVYLPYPTKCAAAVCAASKPASSSVPLHTLS